MSGDANTPVWLADRFGRPYFRVSVRVAKGRYRKFWGAQMPRKSGSPYVGYCVVQNDGSPAREGTEADVREIILASEKDIVSVRPARLNLRYEEMELVP